MDIQEIINNTEAKYLIPLETWFSLIWKETNLLSHDLSHHKRVWKYAKELILSAETQNRAEYQKFTDKLIIACYLHDIGISVDKGFRHGKKSREICTQFLIENNLEMNDFRDLLDAIEHHDNKEYSGASHCNKLLTILSVADDLDAFGYIGIYRYSEIYLIRNIHRKELGKLIQKNAENRFINFSSFYKDYPSIIEKHRIRYLILYDFFDNYNKQLGSYLVKGNQNSSYIGIIELINSLVRDEILLESVFNNTKDYQEDPVILSFFTNLRLEMSS